MTIGELSKRTDASARSIRHYESKGLLKSLRGANGYRLYDEQAVDVVIRIRWLLAAGLNSRGIKSILHCVKGKSPRVVLCAETRATLQREIARIDEQLDALRSSRSLLAGILGKEGGRAKVEAPAKKTSSAGQLRQVRRSRARSAR